MGTLNASFQPDYDFSDAKSHEFSREPSVEWVKSAVRTAMATSASEHFGRLESVLWTTLEDEISLSDCEIYRYAWLDVVCVCVS